MEFSEEKYDKMIADLFSRVASFQNVGSSAYKPGTERMEFFDSLLGQPHRAYRTIHIAGTNGKGSTSNMIASALGACGMRVGLFTSPHILDFRERMRIFDGSLRLIPRVDVWNFVQKWSDTFSHLDLSFFEITTAMAFWWFEKEKVDVAVIETGLGGRLDSTNIISPVLSVITNIGLDHCDLLGNTLGEIAFEKAGIIKPGVPVVIGESHLETDTIFERKVLYSNASSMQGFFTDKTRALQYLSFADKQDAIHPELFGNLDLKGEYQKKNLQTVMVALRRIEELSEAAFGRRLSLCDDACVQDAICHTAERMGFHGRWEQVCDSPRTICDIGHNEHGLRNNFKQLEDMLTSGKTDRLIIVYGSVADKDVDASISHFPSGAQYIFTQAQSKRALPAGKIYEKYLASGRDASKALVVEKLAEAVKQARKMAEGAFSPLIYIGGSTFVVSEALASCQELNRLCHME